jgi:hypothetical protein
MLSAISFFYGRNITKYETVEISWFAQIADVPNRFAQFLDRMDTKPK